MPNHDDKSPDGAPEDPQPTDGHAPHDSPHATGSSGNGNGHDPTPASTPGRRARRRARKEALAASLPPDLPVGGSGGLLSDPKKARSDMRMIETAIRRRWNTQDKIKELLLNKVAQVGLTAVNPRWLMRAAYVWLAAERQNMADEHVNKPAQVLHAHIDATALAAVSQLPLEDLRALRRIRAQLAGQAAVIDEQPADGDGNGQAKAE